MKQFYWTGCTNKQPNLAISEIEQIINHHGFIVDFKRFSDISISMIIEIQEQKTSLLYNELKQYMILNDPDSFASVSEDDCTILFSITFTRGTGDLRIEIPSVPG